MYELIPSALPFTLCILPQSIYIDLYSQIVDYLIYTKVFYRILTYHIFNNLHQHALPSVGYTNLYYYVFASLSTLAYIIIYQPILHILVPIIIDSHIFLKVDSTLAYLHSDIVNKDYKQKSSVELLVHFLTDFLHLW